jgi:hypothetical protein
MLELLQNWTGKVKIDDVVYDSIRDVPDIDSDTIHISLLSNTKRQDSHPGEFQDTTNKVYKITVRQYMTKPSTPSFDFMAKWNNDVPMPLRTMIGTVDNETKGMVHMNLHGDITDTQTQFCMKCGKQITNPVSQYFGMGPECGGHRYVNPFDSEEELKEAVEKYRKEYLQKITWSGWIIRSAIELQEEIEET